MMPMRNLHKSGAAKRTRPNGQKTTDREEVPAVGNVLRRARQHQQLSIREVARRIGKSSAYLSQIELGDIRQPDPVVLLALAELYKLDFMTLAKWAGWAGGGERAEGGKSATLLVSRVLELDDSLRAEVLRYIEKILHERQS